MKVASSLHGLSRFHESNRLEENEYARPLGQQLDLVEESPSDPRGLSDEIGVAT